MAEPPEGNLDVIDRAELLRQDARPNAVTRCPPLLGVATRDNAHGPEHGPGIRRIPVRYTHFPQFCRSRTRTTTRPSSASRAARRRRRPEQRKGRSSLTDHGVSLDHSFRIPATVTAKPSVVFGSPATTGRLIVATNTPSPLSITFTIGFAVVRPQQQHRGVPPLVHLAADSSISFFFSMSSRLLSSSAGQMRQNSGCGAVPVWSPMSGWTANRSV